MYIYQKSCIYMYDVYVYIYIYKLMRHKYERCFTEKLIERTEIESRHLSRKSLCE